MEQRKPRPATVTFGLRNFPLPLKHAIERIKLERMQEDPGVDVSNGDIVAEAVTYWLEHRGHAPADTSPNAAKTDARQR